MLIYWVWLFLALNAITLVAMIGKPRSTITPGVAAMSLVILLLLGIGAWMVR